MLHKNRCWRIAEVATLKDLAEKLTQYTWTTCTGFRHEHLLFLNDAFSENGAQEYGVVDVRTGHQIESLTASWMTAERFAQLVAGYLAAEKHDFDLGAVNLVPHPEGSCWACA